MIVTDELTLNFHILHYMFGKACDIVSIFSNILLYMVIIQVHAFMHILSVNMVTSHIHLILLILQVDITVLTVFPLPFSNLSIIRSK